jgi:MFS transporter, DHA2 family, multidrug resistance protein
VRDRIHAMEGYFTSHGVSDPSLAHHEALVAIGNTIKQQALILSFSDTFAVIGVMLAIAAVSLLFARKGSAGAVAAH